MTGAICNFILGEPRPHLPTPLIIERSAGILVELQKTPVKTPVETPEAIKTLLKEEPTLTLAEVATRINKSLSAVERATKKLREQGVLVYTGPQKGGRWSVLES